jgi:hypothetical protein
LRVHCVSRPADQDFARFLNDDCDFDAHCVSRRIPDNFGQWIAFERRTHPLISANALTKPSLEVVVRMPCVPLRARAPMTRPLARLSIATPLPLTRARVRLEPLAALSARSFAGHRGCLLEEARSVTCLGSRPSFYSLVTASAWVGHFSRA